MRKVYIYGLVDKSKNELKYIFEIEIKLMEETLQNDEFISIHRNQINP